MPPHVILPDVKPCDEVQDHQTAFSKDAHGMKLLHYFLKADLSLKSKIDMTAEVVEREVCEMTLRAFINKHSIPGYNEPLRIVQSLVFVGRRITGKKF